MQDHHWRRTSPHFQSRSLFTRTCITNVKPNLHTKLNDRGTSELINMLGYYSHVYHAAWLWPARFVPSFSSATWPFSQRYGLWHPLHQTCWRTIRCLHTWKTTQIIPSRLYVSRDAATRTGILQSVCPYHIENNMWKIVFPARRRWFQWIHVGSIP